MKHTLLLTSIILSTTCLFSQSDFLRQPAFNISLVHHTVGIPFKDFFKKPLNLGLSFSVDFPYTDRQFQRLEVGWYKHKNFASALWVKTDYVRRFQDSEGLFADVRGGIGFIRDFNALDSYELTSEGVYQLKKRHGKSGLIGGLGVAGGYSFEPAEATQLSPFLDYQGFIQFPYLNIAPVLPHSLLSIGTRFQKN
ncbi:MAG: hypothetical protein AAGI23_10470 [Bacteroidota bacterium]